MNKAFYCTGIFRYTCSMIPAAIIETWITGGCTQPASEIAENIIRLSGILIHGF